MKEEYLEIEEYDYADEVYPTVEIEETPQQNDDLHSASKDQKNMELFPLQPLDFDNQSDDAMLRKLLTKFQMNFLYPFFKAYDVTYRSLRYLSVDDINAVIRSVGHRAEFREKLFAWRRKRYRTNDTIIECEKSTPSGTSPSSGKTQNAKSLDLTTNSKVSNETHTKASSTATFENVIKTMKRDASEFDSSSMHDMSNEVPLEIEIDAMEAKKLKLDSNVDLKDNRLNMIMNLEEIVDESVFGPIMKAFYKKNGYLERKHRDELIQTIVNFVITKEIKLHSSDFGKIVDMIANIFPTEDDARDYYFINRKGKRNPMGRLYTKYYNTLKRMRVKDIHQEFTQESSSYLQSSTLADDTILTTTGPPTTTAMTTSTSLMLGLTNANDANNITNSNGNSCNNSANASVKGNGRGSGSGSGNGSGNSHNTQIELIEDEFQELIELDDTSASAIKNFLRCQGLNWDDVKTMWSKTYLSRQEDIEHSTIKDVLMQWPKYLNARGMDLFDIDFRLKFSRNRANILQRKWPTFVKKISHYYQTNIKDEMCKGFYALYKTNPGKDTEDYILTVLLNSIMIPMARYRDAIGNRRKVSIVEAVDLFAIRVNHLEELDQKREEFSIKFGEIHSDFTPLIVVVGDNNINIHEIYVHFDVALYEMPDFVSALDCCMKIYRVLNLQFPASNEYVWTFLQRYFYEMRLPDDIICPSMSSLISALKF